MSDIFKNATKKKYRFNFRGICTVEDLWDLSVENLDAIYKILKKQQNENEAESLLAKNKNEDNILNDKIEIIKEIVADKIETKKKIENAAKKRAQNQRILEIIADKENDELKNKSIDDLKAMLASVAED